MIQRLFLAALLLVGMAVSGCGDSRSHSNAVYMLVDTSGTYAQEAGKTKTIIIFSDMQEELDKATIRNFPISLKNIRIIAVNVVKLKTDNIDPRRYLGRLEAWQKRVEGAGASEWRVINDLERLDAIFSKS